MFSRARFITMIAVVAGTVLGLGATEVVAAVPDSINFQGILKNSGGSPVPNGNYSVTFSIYDAPTDGLQLWNETQSVTTAGGLFNVFLGKVTNLPISALSAPNRFVQIQVSPDPPMAQRVALTSAGFASVTSRVNGDIYTYSDSDSSTVRIRPSDVPGFTMNSHPPADYPAGVFAFAGDDRAGLFLGQADSLTFIEVSFDSCAEKIVFKKKGKESEIKSVAPVKKGSDIHVENTNGNDGNPEHIFVGFVGNIPQPDTTWGLWSDTTYGARMTFFDTSGAPTIVIKGATGEITGATFTFGNGNCNSGYSAFVAGDSGCASGAWSTIAGGLLNSAPDSCSAIGGGVLNLATVDTTEPGPVSFSLMPPAQTMIAPPVVSGGKNNNARGEGAGVGSGDGNLAKGKNTRVGGGGGNRASADGSNVGGGNNNNAAGQNSSVGGGSKNSATGHYAAIPGGQNDTASADWSAVGGGLHNKANGLYATIPGGVDNRASGNTSTVLGGWRNVASGSWSTVAGGLDNVASGQTAFGAGRGANAAHDGSFVWADFTPASGISSTGPDQFIVRASGGLWLGTTNSPSIPAGDFLNTSTGAHLTFSGTWTNNSDARSKENYTPVNREELLNKIAALPITRWNYKVDPENIQHIGPTAQDFYAAFGVGNGNHSISTIDPGGVALAAIQALNEKLNQQTAENAQLRSLIEKLARRVDELSHSKTDK